MINGEVASLRTVLKSGDVVAITLDENAAPNAMWLNFAKTGRARSKIRNHLKTVAQTESAALGEQLLTQALREEGIADLPSDEEAQDALWQAILKPGQTQTELLSDIGLGRQVATLVAQQITAYLQHQGQRPDALLLTQQRFTQGNRPQRSVILDSQNRTATHYAPCCTPVPGDAVIGYLGHGDGLHIHRSDCPEAQRLLERQPERHIAVEWGEEIHNEHLYNANITLAVQNGRGVLARIAQVLADSDVDIRRVDIEDESAMQTTVLRFTIAVHDQLQLESALRALRRNAAVLSCSRVLAP